jgi:hypothetical protein
MLPNTTKWAALTAVATGIALTSAAVLGRTQAQPEPEAKKADVKQFPPAAEPVPPEAAEPQKEEVPFDPAPIDRHRKTIMLDGRVVERPYTGFDDIRSRRVLAKLEEPISMSFAAETPLDDVLKYIKQATTTPTFSGIPIYVDPVGLQEAERSINSTIQLDLEGVPLRRTLQLMLTQLGLAYFVEDGILVITSEDSVERRLPPCIRARSPILEKAEQARRGELTVSEMKELIELFKVRKQVVQMAEQDPSALRPDPTEELLNEVRQLVQLLRAEKGVKKAPQGGGLQ